MAGAVAEVVARVFATVAAVRSAALRPGAHDGFTAGRTVLGADVRDLLLDADQLAVGLGLVVAPRAERPLRLEWWQVDPEGGRLRTLEPDLRPTSMGYYDYTATEWFDVPRRTGRRHVVGPYVDVHGTGRYLLTLTEPVVVDGEFVGVAGADVSVRRFETHLLRLLGPSPGRSSWSTTRAGWCSPRHRTGWWASWSRRARSPPVQLPRWPVRRGGCWPRRPRAS